VDVALSTSSSNFNNSTSGNHGISSASGNQQDDTAASCPLSPVLSSGATQQQRRFGQWRSLGGSRRNNSQKSRFLPRATTLDTSRSPDTEIGECRTAHARTLVHWICRGSTLELQCRSAAAG
jgi:hypothetical protein